jgi:S1-C subfamily serine protease
MRRMRLPGAVEASYRRGAVRAPVPPSHLRRLRVRSPRHRFDSFLLQSSLLLSAGLLGRYLPAELGWRPPIPSLVPEQTAEVQAPWGEAPLAGEVAPGEAPLPGEVESSRQDGSPAEEPPAVAAAYLADPDVPAEVPDTIKRANASTVVLYAVGQPGMGSGVIIDAEAGLIVTARHVPGMAGTREFKVRLSDGRELRAVVTKLAAQTDPPILSDLALLQIENPPDDLVAATIGDTASLRAGTPVWTVGAPGCDVVSSRSNCGPEQLREGQVTQVDELDQGAIGAAIGGGGPRSSEMPLPDSREAPLPAPMRALPAPSRRRSSGLPEDAGASDPEDGILGRVDPVVRRVVVLGKGINPATGQAADMAKAGSSGGGVFDPEGRLVGLISGGPTQHESQGIDETWAVPAENIAAFVAGDLPASDPEARQHW